MTVIDRTALEDSPLADLHAIASELSIDGYRRLRKEQLIDAILERQEGGADETQAEPEDAEDEPAAARTRRRRGRRGGRGSVRPRPRRRPSGRVPARALRVRRRRPDDQGDRIAQSDRQGVARGHRRAGAHRKDGDPSPADGGVVKARRSQIAALAG